MPDRLQAGQALLRAVDAVERRKYRAVLTGRLLEDGSIVLAGAPTNKCWVRYPYDSREQTLAWGQVGAINVPVWIGPSLDGGNEVKGIAWQTGTYTLGGALITLSQPPHVGGVGPGSISGLEFTPGLVRASELGYPLVHVEGFWYDTGYWDDGALIGNPALYDFDLSSYVTATVGYSQWVLIYFDPSARVLRASANPPVLGGVGVLRESAIDLSAIPAGMYPLGAAKVAYGQTVWAATDFASPRFFLSPKGDVGGEWIVDYVSVVPAGASGIIPRGIRVTSAGSLTIQGSVYIV